MNQNLLSQVQACIHAVEAENSSLAPSLLSKLREVEQALKSQQNPDQGQVYGSGEAKAGSVVQPEKQAPSSVEQQEPNQDKETQPDGGVNAQDEAPKSA